MSFQTFYLGLLVYLIIMFCELYVHLEFQPFVKQICIYFMVV